MISSTALVVKGSAPVLGQAAMRSRSMPITSTAFTARATCIPKGHTMLISRGHLAMPHTYSTLRRQRWVTATIARENLSPFLQPVAKNSQICTDLHQWPLCPGVRVVPKLQAPVQNCHSPGHALCQDSHLPTQATAEITITSVVTGVGTMHQSPLMKDFIIKVVSFINNTEHVSSTEKAGVPQLLCIFLAQQWPPLAHQHA